MSGYIIIELTIFDKEEIKKYKELAPETIKDFEGEIIVRGGEKILLEGDWDPQRLVILKFPSVEKAKAWYNSEQYKEVSFYRNKAARTNMIIIEGK